MPLTYYEHPKQKITVTHNETSYQLEGHTLTSDVILRENKISNARILANDEKGITFLNKCDIGDFLKIEFMYEDKPGDSWTQKFGGWISSLKPQLELLGELVGVEAFGMGIALKRMRVREEYGSQSVHDTLNKIKEILTDATYGIIPKYVEKIFAGATSSGYSINTTKIADVASDFKYLYFPYKPAMKCIEDMLDLISAANVPGAGVHWIIIPVGTTPYLCLATVGAHEDPPADIWPTWWNTDEVGSTITVTKDMVASRFHKREHEANYVLIIGDFRRPANGDKWSENNSVDWDYINHGGGCACGVSDENGAGYYKIGSYSIKGKTDIATCGLCSSRIWYPKTYDLNFNMNNIGTKHVIPRVGFYIYVNDKVITSSVELGIGTGDPNNDDYFRLMLDDHMPSQNEWRHINLPIGQYYDVDEASHVEWEKMNNADWADIDWVAIGWDNLVGGDAFVWIDGLYFAGLITRAAYDNAKITSQKCRMMFIRDDVPKDDLLIATDDSGMLAQFCKAELYRAIYQPILGSIKIPLIPKIWPGQLAHINASRKVVDYHIDKNMRMLEVRHHYGLDGAFSLLTLTDDVKNSFPISPINAYSAIAKAVAPDFQDRQRGSFKGSIVDIDQVILGKNYST